MQATNRIIVNTIAQYIRTILNMLLSLYSARLVLEILGVDDYGIYALVAGVVSMLSFLTNSLVTSTQRFLSISQGKGNIDELKSVFGNSLLLHIIIGFVIFLILEVLTPFLFNGFLNIPVGRTDAAMLIYQQVVLMVYISFVAAPYRALLVSRENIVYTSLIDVMDGVLKVVLVIILMYLPFDKLETYGWMMMSISLFNLLSYSIYSHIKYEECVFPKISLFRLSYLKEIAGFTGWVTYSAISISLRNQGLAIVLNRAMGTAVNAAYGVGAQISGMVSFISASFNNAVSPQLTASEGGGERERMWRLAAVGSKMPFLLLALIGIPTIFEMQTLLELWLVKVPEYTMYFGCTFLIMQIIDQWTIGLAAANRAIGNLGLYTFVTCTPKLLILPFGWYILVQGRGIDMLCMTLILIEVGCMLLRIPLLRRQNGFNASDFIHNVIIKTIPPVIISIFVCYIVNLLLEPSFIRLLATFTLSIITFMFTAYKVSLNHVEKQKVDQLLERVSKIIKSKR